MRATARGRGLLIAYLESVFFRLRPEGVTSGLRGCLSRPRRGAAMARSGQRKCLCCGSFSSPMHATATASGTAPPPRAGERARPPARPLGWPNPRTAGTSATPSMLRECRPGAPPHPDHGRGKRASAPALQDPLIAQVVDPIEESPIRGDLPEIPRPPALQDLLNAPSPLLAGLIAHLFELTLQDDMAATTRRLVQLGNEVIHGGGHEASQASAAA